MKGNESIENSDSQSAHGNMLPESRRQKTFKALQREELFNRARSCSIVLIEKRPAVGPFAALAQAASASQRLQLETQITTNSTIMYYVRLKCQSIPTLSTGGYPNPKRVPTYIAVDCRLPHSATKERGGGSASFRNSVKVRPAPPGLRIGICQIRRVW